MVGDERLIARLAEEYGPHPAVAGNEVVFPRAWPACG